MVIRMTNDDKNEETKISDMAVDMEGISESIRKFVDNCRKIASAHIIENMSNVLSGVSKMLASVDVSLYMTSFKEAFSRFFDELEEARNNPYSYFNFFDYEKKLDDFHWAWPYGITPEEMKKLLEEATNEQEFDGLMMSFFSKERINEMCEQILNQLPRKHRSLFSQIVVAYNQRYYALINNALFSIIDNLLIEVLKNKGMPKRKGILEPIIKFYADNYRLSEIDFIFELQMLSNNINLLFGDYTVNEIKELNTNKKARRHLAAHGVMYSNRRCDSVMLLNTLKALLDNIKYIEPFKGCLAYRKKDKEFFVDTKRYVVKNRIIKQLQIETMEE